MAETLKSDQIQDNDNIVVAAEHGRLDLVTKLLENGEDPNTVNDIGTSALHNAAKEGHWDIARFLLEKGAIPGLLDGNDRTPLLFAAREGHKPIVGLLLECDPVSKGSNNEEKELELHRSLRAAALFGHTEIVQLLLDHNAPTLSDAGRETALLLAAKKGHHEICDLLLKHDMALNRSLWTKMTGPSLAVDGKDYDGNSPFAHAVQNGFEKTVDVFLRHYPTLCHARDREKVLLFHKIIRMGKIDLVRVFMDHGTDVEIKGPYGKRALHEAVNSGMMYYRPVEDTAEMIKFLIENGASATSKDNDGRTADTYTNDPKIRTLLRSYMKPLPKGNSQVSSKALAPPPEYKA